MGTSIRTAETLLYTRVLSRCVPGFGIPIYFAPCPFLLSSPLRRRVTRCSLIFTAVCTRAINEICQWANRDRDTVKRASCLPGSARYYTAAAAAAIPRKKTYMYQKCSISSKSSSLAKLSPLQARNIRLAASATTACAANRINRI